MILNEEWIAEHVHPSRPRLVAAQMCSEAALLRRPRPEGRGEPDREE
jgi:hypothetical protein